MKTLKLWLSTLILLASTCCFSQGTSQIIGEVPGISGGFEDMFANPVNETGNLSGQSEWTKWNGTATYYAEGGRSGHKYLNFGHTAAARLRSSTTGSEKTIARNTSYVFQFYYRNTGNTNNLTCYLQTSGNNDVPSNAVAITVNNTSGEWTKVSGTLISENTYNSTANGHFGFRLTGSSGNNIDIDDLCVYQGQELDETAPEAPQNAILGTETPWSLYISWEEPEGGVDGGGYLVVRGTSDPATTPNANGIYKTGNTIGNAKVVYIGTNTKFTDIDLGNGLAENTKYYYRIYALDKAFNYSEAALVSGTTAPLTANDYRFNTSSGNWSVSSNWLTYNGSSWVTAISAPDASTTNVYITGSRTVYLDASPSCNNLTISQAALLFDNNASRSLTIHGNLSNSGLLRPVTTENAYGQSAVKTHTLTLKGSLYNFATITTATDRDGTNTYYKCMRIELHFTGNNNAVISNFGTMYLRHNIVINKATAEQSLGLGSHIGINAFTSTDNPTQPELILTLGKLMLGDYDFTISSGSSCSQGSESSYIVSNGSGSLVLSQPSVASGHAVPIGTATSFNPLIFNYTGDSDNFSFRVDSGLTQETGSDLHFVNRTWHIAEESSGGSTASITFQWNEADENANFTRNAAKVFRYDTLWTELTSGNLTGSNPYTLQATDITSFGKFGIGNMIICNNAIPISSIDSTSYLSAVSSFDNNESWFVFTPICPQIKISVFDPSVSSRRYDSRISLYSGNCDDLALLAEATTSILDYSILETGQNYYIKVTKEKEGFSDSLEVLLTCGINNEVHKTVTAKPNYAQRFLVMNKHVYSDVHSWEVELVGREYEPDGTYQDTISMVFTFNSNYMRFSPEIFDNSNNYLIIVTGRNLHDDVIVTAGPIQIVTGGGANPFSYKCGKKCNGLTYAWEVSMYSNDLYTYFDLASTFNYFDEAKQVAIPYYQYMGKTQFDALENSPNWHRYYNVSEVLYPATNAIHIIRFPNPYPNTIYKDGQNNPITKDASDVIYGIQKYLGPWANGVIQTHNIGNIYPCSYGNEWWLNKMNQYVDFQNRTNALGQAMPELSCNMGWGNPQTPQNPFTDSLTIYCGLDELTISYGNFNAIGTFFSNCLSGIDSLLNNVWSVFDAINISRIDEISEQITITEDSIYGITNGLNEFNLDSGLYVFGLVIKDGTYLPLFKELEHPVTFLIDSTLIESLMLSSIINEVFPVSDDTEEISSIVMLSNADRTNISISPVPLYSDEFNINISTDTELFYKYILVDMYGVELYNSNFSVDNESTTTIKLDKKINSGVLLNIFIFADGSVKTIKTIKM